MQSSFNVLSLCSGIGGFELGAEMVNAQLGHELFRLKALCERNTFCQQVLTKNFPGVPIYDDIRAIKPIRGEYDLIVGGLPCQPFSLAGKRKGENDDRNLFPEFFRILRAVRPIGAVIENVPGLLTIDNGRVFRDILWQFSQAGYSVEWNTVSCAEVGGVHKRDRLWIIAHSNSVRYDESQTGQSSSDQEWNNPPFESARTAELYETVSSGATTFDRSSVGASSNSNGIGCDNRPDHRQRGYFQDNCNGCIEESESARHGRIDRLGALGSDVADSNGERCEKLNPATVTSKSRFDRRCAIGNFDESGCTKQEEKTESRFRGCNDGLSSRMARSHLMTAEELPDFLTQATDTNEVQNRKEMLQALGNAIVPDVAAVALRRFLEIVSEQLTPIT